MLGKNTGNIVYLILALIWGYGVYSLAVSDSYQWDFKTYYYAAEAFSRGLDWWDPVVLSGVAHMEVKLAYVYPPATIWFFRAFTVFDYDVAYQIWLFLKLGLLGLLVLLWYRVMLRDDDLPLFLLFVTLAFGSAAYWDLVAGNIGIVEQAVLWLAIWALQKDRIWLFAIGILLISLFKLTFIVFLLLPLLVGKARSLRPLLVGGGLFALYLLLNQFLFEREFGVFWSILESIDERGEAYNHALLAFARDSWEAVAKPFGGESSAVIAGTVVYVLIAAAILILSWRWWKRQASSGSPAPELATIALFSLSYALAMPRMKTYSFILLIPVTWYVLRNSLKSSGFVLLFILVSLTKWTPLPAPDLARLLWWYYPWLTALLIWGILIFSRSQEAGSSH